MVNTFNKGIIEEIFNAKYEEQKFKSFIADLLNDADFTKEQMIQPIPNDYKDFIRSAKRLCKYTYSINDYDETTIDVLVVKLKKVSSIDRARTAQRNFIARYLNGGRNYQKDAALVVFLSEDENENISDDWRLSLVKMDYKRVAVTDENGNIKKVKTEVELTPAKRFSFLVEKNGAHYNTHTVQSRFAALLEKSTSGAKLTIEDLVSAFDIEKVSKEFFDEYKKLYVKMCDELNRLCTVDKEIKKDFEDNKIIIEDFAKKTMGQLVFLYFIQKKGWLGVEQDKEWGTGDKNFMRNIFDKVYCEYDNFFNDVLEHLFYEALAKKRTNQNDIFEFPNNKKVCRIPFLNGGLFEPVNNYKYEITNITIDNGIFKEIFDTFDLYNFTVKEDEPLEKEVAVDPEMLGKVFENLLPENIRKGNGAFYTPREIVHYMCQESLINYLYNKINTKTVELSPQQKAEQQNLFKKKKIEQLVLTEEVFEEKISKEDISELIKKGDSAYKNKNRKVDTELPKTIIDNSKELDDALASIKVCDPAIGSGAFPVGMMNEIVRARSVLSPEKSIYDLKRNAIENSIYGVDLDGGAVEIAKLRFWLSLVVDEENTKIISPLPNLDYKIMQGNSLITSYEGIDFDEIVEEYKPNNLQLTINLWGDKSQDLKYDLKLLMDKFFAVSNPEDKKNLKEQIENKIVELVKNKFEEKAKTEGKPANFYEEDIRNFAKNKENRNFFPWKLFFGDAFENGGFDVVIGNPPYVQLQKFKGDPVQKLYKDANYKVHDSNGDLYCLFYEKGIDVLKHNGCLSYITSNKWMRAGYGEKLREFFVTKNPIQLVDFGGFGVFDSATVDVNILFVQNAPYKRNTLSCAMNKDFDSLNKLSVFIEQNSTNQTFDKNSWCILNPIEQSIKEKIERIGTPLKEWDVNIYRGVLTGLNEAFIIDGAKKDELIAKDPKSAEIIRPILRGRDIQRYSYNFADKWLIATFPSKHYNIDDYPAVRDYLLTFDKRVLAQTGEKDIDGIKGKNARKKTCNKWFETQDSIAYWDDFNSQIIAWQRITQKPTFCLTKEKTLVLDSMAFLSKMGKYKYLLLAVLNSNLIYFWAKLNVHEYGDTGFRLSNQYVEQISIPLVNNSKLEEIEPLVIKALNNNSDISNEKEIQIFIYNLYGITKEEQIIIEQKIL